MAKLKKSLNYIKKKGKKRNKKRKIERFINRESGKEYSQITKEFGTIRIAQKYLTLNSNEFSRKCQGSKCAMREVLPDSVTHDSLEFLFSCWFPL